MFFHRAALGAAIIELNFFDKELFSCCCALIINRLRASVACSKSNSELSIES